MNTRIFRTKLKRLAVPLLAVATLGGCVAVPYDDGYYGQTTYATPAYAAPVYVAPSVNFGLSYSNRGYYGPRYYPRYYGRGYWGGGGGRWHR